MKDYVKKCSRSWCRADNQCGDCEERVTDPGAIRSIKVEPGYGLKDNPIARVLSMKVAEGIFSVRIETYVQNPRFAQWVTGGNLHVHGVDVFPGTELVGPAVKVFIEMPDTAHWVMDAVEGRHEVRLWIVDSSIISRGYTSYDIDWDAKTRRTA